MGLAYQHEGRYEDAIAQFRKQIEINPLDAFAHGNLGRILLIQKKYAEAVPELEKAVNIQPKNPVLQIHLGQAYLGAGQTEKGMAAFEKATSLSATPMTWNNIAYALSEQNTQLDRASQYADTAINALQTQLRDINLDNLRVQDLATESLMISVWDTKGWIEFQRGNLDTAEAYVLPAFLAGGRGDEAEHLGEIYEKRGKRDDAIRYYLFSLLSENPAANARAKLEGLGVKDIDSRLANARTELQKQRTTSLKQSGKGKAEFFVLMSPGKVEQVKFIKGDDGMKTFTDVLQKSDLTMKFLPDIQTHVVRRAIVQCGTTAEGPCTVEVVPSSQVRSLD